MPSKYWNEIKKRRPAYAERFASQSLDIIDQIHFLLQEKGWTQKDLAQALGKSESEISKWLSAGHNLTIKTVAKIEAELGTDVLQTPLRFRAQQVADASGGDRKVAYRQVIQSFETELAQFRSQSLPDVATFTGATEIETKFWSVAPAPSSQSGFTLEEKPKVEVDTDERDLEGNYAMAA
jgi:transcriptional regulator with XRE-family HTH domain